MITSHRSHWMPGRVAAALLVLPVLTSCGTQLVPPPQVDPPVAEAPATTSAPAISTSFTFDPPSGWRDEPSAGGLPPEVQFERLVVGPQVAGFQTNINVVSQAALPGATSEAVAGQTLAAIRASGQQITAEPGPAGDFDSVDGVRYTWVGQPAAGSDQVVTQTQFALLRGGRHYFVTVSGDQKDPDLDKALDRVRATWEWTS